MAPVKKLSSGSLSPVGKFPGVMSMGNGRRQRFFVRSLVSTSFFGEFVVSVDGTLYREVDPSRSKLFAGIAKGLSQIGFKQDSSVLYLGASHGYTVSFLSGMVLEGCVFALDFAPRVVSDLVFVSQQLSNVAPLMANAKIINSYKGSLPSSGVDVVFMDIAQKDQVGIFLKNCDNFLKQGGFGLLALKARSEDVTKNPKDVFREVRKRLDEKKTVVDYRELAPFENDHALFVVKNR